MVVRMMKWSPWPPISGSKKFQVKVKPMKLEGMYRYYSIEDENIEKVVMVQVIWKGPKLGLPPALRRSPKRHFSTIQIVFNGVDIEWDDEFESVCNISASRKDNSLIPWEVTLNLLYGQTGDSKSKFAVIGTVSLNLAELVSEMKAEIERKVPVDMKIDGVASEGSFLVSVSFIEIGGNSSEIVEDSTELEKTEGFLRKMKDLARHGSKKKKKKIQVDEGEESTPDRISGNFSGDTDESATFDSEGSPSIYNNDKELGGVTQLGASSLSLRNQLDSPTKLGFWKKRKLHLRSSRKKETMLIKNTNGEEDGRHSNVDCQQLSCFSNDPIGSTKKANDRLVGNSSSEFDSTHKELSIGRWEEKELISRDGKAKLKANIFFASMDQRSEKASGESACTPLVTVIADWLHSNQDQMPTSTQFDNLIIEGSLEWRKLCENDAYLQRFPDKHFDLETVLEANLRPLYIAPNKSFIGFFFPDRFKSLEGAMSFNEIWDHLRSNVKEGESHIYIVSWNDHFFVMKVEVDAYYIIDTLGERLFEGCDKAYILKFDDTSEIYKLAEKNVNGVETQERETTEEGEELVCKGKECCLEFFKRFLAAIPLRELEMEEEKENASSIPVHQRLQIEFHFTSSSS